jgi:hypothetical protein
MTQEPLFFDDWRDAARHAIAACGGPKAVATQMRPDLKPDHAARWLMDCLNADRRENLNPDQLMHLMRIARQAGVHCVMQYICTDLGYTVPAPTDPIDAAAELRREYIEATRRLMKMAERIESLEAQASLRVVR